jgi:hypothetical protein
MQQWSGIGQRAGEEGKKARGGVPGQRGGAGASAAGRNGERMRRERRKRQSDGDGQFPHPSGHHARDKPTRIRRSRSF